MDQLHESSELATLSLSQLEEELRATYNRDFLLAEEYLAAILERAIHGDKDAAFIAVQLLCKDHMCLAENISLQERFWADTPPSLLLDACDSLWGMQWIHDPKAYPGEVHRLVRLPGIDAERVIRIFDACGSRGYLLGLNMPDEKLAELLKFFEIVSTNDADRTERYIHMIYDVYNGTSIPGNEETKTFILGVIGTMAEDPFTRDILERLVLPTRDYELWTILEKRPVRPVRITPAEGGLTGYQQERFDLLLSFALTYARECERETIHSGPRAEDLLPHQRDIQRAVTILLHLEEENPHGLAAALEEHPHAFDDIMATVVGQLLQRLPPALAMELDELQTRKFTLSQRLVQQASDSAMQVQMDELDSMDFLEGDVPTAGEELNYDLIDEIILELHEENPEGLAMAMVDVRSGNRRDMLPGDIDHIDHGVHHSIKLWMESALQRKNRNDDLDDEA